MLELFATKGKKIFARFPGGCGGRSCHLAHAKRALTIWANPPITAKFTVKCNKSCDEYVQKFSYYLLLGLAVSIKGAFSSSKLTPNSRNSSVGRASDDWRSEGPWFNPGFQQHVHFLSSCTNFCYSSSTTTCWSRHRKNQHFWHTFILVFWKTIRFPSLQTVTWYKQRAFYVQYGKFSLFNFNHLPKSFQFLTERFNISVASYVIGFRTQNCREIMRCEERMR